MATKAPKMHWTQRIKQENQQLKEQLASVTKCKEELEDSLNHLESELASAGIHPPYEHYVKKEPYNPMLERLRCNARIPLHKRGM